VAGETRKVRFYAQWTEERPIDEVFDRPDSVQPRGHARTTTVEVNGRPLAVAGSRPGTGPDAFGLVVELTDRPGPESEDGDGEGA